MSHVHPVILIKQHLYATVVVHNRSAYVLDVTAYTVSANTKPNAKFNQAFKVYLQAFAVVELIRRKLAYFLKGATLALPSPT